MKKKLSIWIAITTLIFTGTLVGVLPWQPANIRVVIAIHMLSFFFIPVSFYPLTVLFLKYESGRRLSENNPLPFAITYIIFLTSCLMIPPVKHIHTYSIFHHTNPTALPQLPMDSHLQALITQCLQANELGCYKL